jgi:hypothetical protein
MRANGGDDDGDDGDEVRQMPSWQTRPIRELQLNI